LVQDGGEQVKQRFQALDVLDQPDNLEAQLINVFREGGTEPPLAVFYVQPDLGLSLNHLADSGVGEKPHNLGLVIPLDDEGVVEFGVTHLDVLHAQELAQLAEESLALDREPEALRVHVGGTHPGVCDGRFPARFGICVEGDRPGFHVHLDLASLAETTVDELGPHFLAELPPYIVFVGTKPPHRLVSRIDADTGCCSPNTSTFDALGDALHARLTELLRRYNVNDYAVSVRIVHLKPKVLSSDSGES
jgi:hypothetical protein